MAFLDYTLDISPESKWNIISPTAAAKSTMLYMQEVGRFLAGPNYFTTREGYDSFLIKYTLSGCGKMEYGGKTWQIPQGTMYWVDCNKWNSYRTDPDTGCWDVIWVHFWGGNARFFYDMFLNYNNNEAVLPLPENSIVGHTLQSLLALDNSGHRQLEVDLRSSDLLTQLLSECTLTAMRFSRNAGIPQIVRDIQAHLRQTFRDANSLDELGDIFGLNPYYLQKLFKRHIGQSPNEYCNYLRVAQAKELLRTTHKPVGEVARLVGIENFGYFTRLFKKHEGLTPQEYRQIWPLLPAHQGEETGVIPPQYREK